MVTVHVKAMVAGSLEVLQKIDFVESGSVVMAGSRRDGFSFVW